MGNFKDRSDQFNNMIILSIDTSSSESVVITLEIDGLKRHYTKEAQNHASQVLLPLIVRSLEENNISFSDITKLSFHKGPGSYTGLRVGAAVTNTLSHILQIPVDDHPVGYVIEPVYEEV